MQFRFRIQIGQAVQRVAEVRELVQAVPLRTRQHGMQHRARSTAM